MSEEKSLHWLTVGYVSPGAEAWIKDCGGQVRELSDDPKLIVVALAYDPAGAWTWSHGERQYRCGVEHWTSGELQEASTGITLLYDSTEQTPAEYASAETCFICLPDEEYDATIGSVKEPGQYKVANTPQPDVTWDDEEFNDQPF